MHSIFSTIVCVLFFSFWSLYCMSSFELLLLITTLSSFELPLLITTLSVLWITTSDYHFVCPLNYHFWLPLCLPLNYHFWLPLCLSFELPLWYFQTCLMLNWSFAAFSWHTLNNANRLNRHWNIVESGVKYHQTNKNFLKFLLKLEF